MGKNDQINTEETEKTETTETTDVIEDAVEAMADETAEEEVIKPQNPREAAMNAVLNSRMEELKSEGVDLEPAQSGEPTTEEGAETEGDVAGDEVAGAVEETPQKPKGRMVSVQMSDGSFIDVPEANIKVPVNLDGEASEESLERVVRGYQKESVATKRLEEANRRDKELSQREQQLLARENQRISTDSATNNAPSSPDVRDKAKVIIERLLDGETDEAAELLAGILPGNNPIDTHQVAAIVARDIEGQNAGEWFKNEYQDIVSDPQLMQMADNHATTLVNQNPSMPLRDAFESAGKAVKSWLKKHAPETQPNTQPEDELQARRDAKRAATAHVPKSSAQSTIGKDAPPPPTNSDIIREMKKGRGQPV